MGEFRYIRGDPRRSAPKVLGGDQQIGANRRSYSFWHRLQIAGSHGPARLDKHQWKIWEANAS
jgi:hypothetical protein